MNVKIMEKEGYKFATIGSLIGIGLGVAALISTITLYVINGISIGKLQIYQLTMLIIAGFICPGIIFTLSYLGDKKPIEFLKGKNIPLFFGLAIAFIAILVIVIVAVFLDFLVGYTPGNMGPVVALILCLLLGIGPMIACIYGGLQEILWWHENQ